MRERTEQCVCSDGKTNMAWCYDDGGRMEAGYVGTAGDCVTRSIAIATGRPYQEVYDALNELAQRERPRGKRKRSSARTGVHKPTVRRYLESIGWVWHPTMQIGSGCQVHLCEEELPPGRLILSVSRHLTAVIDKVIHDTHDPQRIDQTSFSRRCVYGYWAPTEVKAPVPRSVADDFPNLPKPVHSSSRICFSIYYFAAEADADYYGHYIKACGYTYNGGYYHGRPCGRDPGHDYTKDGVKLYAVTH